VWNRIVLIHNINYSELTSQRLMVKEDSRVRILRAEPKESREKECKLTCNETRVTVEKKTRRI
jgi:hypothetical protein